MNDLKIPLSDLNAWLEKNSLTIEIVAIGAFALQLHGISTRITMDIDTIISIHDQKILDKIAEIGEKYGLTDWLNDQADNVVMPEGYKDRLLEDREYSNIHLFYVHRRDLIKLKVAAYFYRCEYEDKDYQDIQALKPSKEEIEEGIAFLKAKHCPDSEIFIPDFLENIKQLEKKFQELVND